MFLVEGLYGGRCTVRQYAGGGASLSCWNNVDGNLVFSRLQTEELIAALSAVTYRGT